MQLESVIYANMKYNVPLKEGESRPGFFLGDGAGAPPAPCGCAPAPAPVPAAVPAAGPSSSGHMGLSPHCVFDAPITAPNPPSLPCLPSLPAP